MKSLTAANLKELFESQIENWPQAKNNYKELSNVISRDVIIDGVNFKVQFNPARIVSSAAKVDAKSIHERKCFLCEENRPSVQEGLEFNSDLGNKYVVLINPFPIFPKHLTIPGIAHRDQLIKGKIGDMLQLAGQLEDYVIFYNGPKCGASAPDHFHFQAGNKGFLPIEEMLPKMERTEIYRDETTSFCKLEKPLRSAFHIQSKSKEEAIRYFEDLYELLPIKDNEAEAMMNILCWKGEDGYSVVVIVREKHRPACYFAGGEENVLISPASVDLGGIFITPLRKDYERMNSQLMKDIIDEVLLSDEHLDQLMEKITAKIVRRQPNVSVGIMFEKKIEVTFHTPYLFNGKVVNNNLTFNYKNESIEWNGEEYSELFFQPQEYDKSLFELKDVTIGINFHWERKENQKFKGGLIIIVENEKLTAINMVGVEDYLLSVISSEMSANAPKEFLKSHAVISRSWLLAQMEKSSKLNEQQEVYNANIEDDNQRIKWYDREDHTSFDVCADDHCQRYQGVTRASNTTVKEVIDQTWGEVLKYNGKICDARFSKCCGGVVEVFPTCWEDAEHPYLVPLMDNEKGTSSFPDLTIEENAEKWILSNPQAYCNTNDQSILSEVLNNYDQETHDFFRWRVEYTVNELSALIKERSGVDFGEIKDLIPIERGTSGRLSKLKIVGSKRTMVFGKELEIRKSLSKSHLFSSAFVVRKEGDRFILIGAGWGHGVGLCQIGAAVMGAKGFSYDKILLHYFVGAEIVRNY